MNSDTKAFDIFRTCVRAISAGKFITAANMSDKEYHFQDWFEHRLDEQGLQYDEPGRNVYPDYTLVDFKEGYELKALAYPGRHKNYDSNSQVPHAQHRGRQIFYVFGRYPSDKEMRTNHPDGSISYPVLDFLMCHASFLNADTTYVHKNKNIKGFGTYGDIMIRDRKMYVVPTPFVLANGTAGRTTLIMPECYTAPDDFQKVGELCRVECDELVCAYEFNLGSNELSTKVMPNPNAGTKHSFIAYSVDGTDREEVTLA